MCASLIAQYEAIMYDWANLGLQDPRVTGTNDPIIGANRPETSRFEIPIEDDDPVVLTGFPRFTHTVGAIYLFCPSLSTLRFLGRPGADRYALMFALRRRGSIRHGAGDVRSSSAWNPSRSCCSSRNASRAGGVDGQAGQGVVEQHRAVHVQVEVGVDEPLVHVDRQRADRPGTRAPARRRSRAGSPTARSR